MDNQRRSASAQSLAELVAGLLVLVPILFACIDLAVCIIAITTNDTAARDAARAAATGRPSLSCYGEEDSSNRARAIISKVYQYGGYIKGPTARGSFRPDDPDSGPQNLSTPPDGCGGSYGGTYRVTTAIVVTLPAAIPNVTPEQLTFCSRQEFPITKNETSTSDPL